MPGAQPPRQGLGPSLALPDFSLPPHSIRPPTHAVDCPGPALPPAPSAWWTAPPWSPSFYPGPLSHVHQLPNVCIRSHLMPAQKPRELTQPKIIMQTCSRGPGHSRQGVCKVRFRPNLTPACICTVCELRSIFTLISDWERKIKRRAVFPDT